MEEIGKTQVNQEKQANVTVKISKTSKTSTMSTKEITLVAIFALVLRGAGMFALPGIIPGTEFFLSAPVALAIARVFGCKIYFFASTISCFMGYLMGMTVVGCVRVALFAWTVVAFCVLFGNSVPVLGIAGPSGTMFARWVIAVATNVPYAPLFLAALPGAIYTLVFYIPCIKVLERIVKSLRMEDRQVRNVPLLLGGIKKQEKYKKV